jgi:hypothetical protein
MIVRLICGVIFGALAAVAVQATDGEPPATGPVVAQAHTAPTSSSASAPPPPLKPMTPIVIPSEMPGAPGYKEPAPVAPATTSAPAPSGTPSPTAAGDAIFKAPNYNLIGVTSVVYGQIFIERLFSHNDDCKINLSELNAAIDLVASQSNKLKFIKFSDHIKRSRELWDNRDELFNQYMKEFEKAREAAPQTAAYQKAQDAYGKAQSEAAIFASMPSLRFHITVAKVEHTCLASVDAKVSAITKGHAKFAATGQDAISSSIEMWSSTGSWVKAPDKVISAGVISTSQTLIKNFIDEWIPASCLKPNAPMCENP